MSSPRENAMKSTPCDRLEKCSHLALRDRQCQRLGDDLKVCQAALSLAQAKIERLEDEADERNEDSERIGK